MSTAIKITESDIRAVIKTMYDQSPGRITLEGARKLANWMYNNLGISVTTLYLQGVWNGFAIDDNN